MWFMTEEAPKIATLGSIADLYGEKHKIPIQRSPNMRVVPLRDERGRFTGSYLAEGLTINDKPVHIGLAHGTGSMIDYLIYDTDSHPSPKQRPDLAIEETKTQDNKSRNVSTSQRLTKFSAIESAYPGVETVMFYNENDMNPDKSKGIPPSSMRGLRVMRTLGVEIAGADRYQGISGYQSVDDIIESNEKPRHHALNVPFTVTMNNDGSISMTAKLSKGSQKNICHDPNEGLVIGTADALRRLGFEGDIVIRSHGVRQDAVDAQEETHKFFQAATRLGIQLEDISLPRGVSSDTYWKDEDSSEKVASILMEVMANNEGLETVFADHAGSERGYLRGSDGKLYEVPAQALDKIPDLVLYNRKKNELLVIEGKQRHTLGKGKQDIQTLDGKFRKFLQGKYPSAKIQTKISIYGGDDASLPDPDVAFQLTSDGRIMTSATYDRFATDVPTAVQKRPTNRRSTVTNEDGPIFVESYCRSDGTKVRSHWRSRPHRHS